MGGFLMKESNLGYENSDFWGTVPDIKHVVLSTSRPTHLN